MIINIHRKRTTLTYRLLSAVVVFMFISSTVLLPNPGYAQAIPTVLNLPVPGTMLPTSPAFVPPMVKGLTIHPDNPLQFDFIVNMGDVDLEEQEFKRESKKLIKYFLASLTVPEDEMWVNLSPNEQDRIIPNNFGVTEMGRDMLAQDYLLKQLTASLLYPEDELGQEFWDKVYQKTQEKYGMTNLPIDTFNKVWIVPDTAVVWEHEDSGTAFVVEGRLKVMLEQDYLTLEKHIETKKESLNEDSYQSINQNDPSQFTSKTEEISQLSSQIIKEVIIPAIEKEVNTGKTFAELRQIYNSMILAAWYKNNLRQTLLGQIYVDKNKTKGIDVEDKAIKQKIYEQYLAAFKKGVYNYIKEDYDPATKQLIPRKYFSGGFDTQKLTWKVGLSTISSPIENLPERMQRLIVERSQRNREVQVVLVEHENESKLVPAFWRRWQRDAEMQKNIVALLEEIETGQRPINFQTPQDHDLETIKALVDALLEAHRALGETIFKGILGRYDVALSSQLMSEDKQQIMIDLEALVEGVYFAVSPQAAINDSSLSIQISYEKGLAKNLGDQVALQIAQPQARREIEEHLASLYWEGDTVFQGDDIQVKVVDQIYQDQRVSGEFNPDQGVILVESGIGVEELKQLFVEARLHQIRQQLNRDFTTDEVSRLSNALSELNEQGKDLAPFLIYYNTVENKDFDSTLALLERMRAGENFDNDSLAALVEQQRVDLEESQGVFKIGKAVFRFLVRHPATVMVPMVVFISAGAAVPSAMPMEVSGAVPGEMAEAGQGEVVGTDDNILSLNDEGSAVRDLGTRLSKFVQPQDIAHLYGQVNELNNNEPYDVFLRDNAEKIYKDAQADAEKGKYTRNVERLVIAFQEKHDLAENGDIGSEVKKKLKNLESSARQQAPPISTQPPDDDEESPEVVSQTVEEIQAIEVTAQSDLGQLREELSKRQEVAEGIADEVAKATVIAAIKEAEVLITAKEARRAQEEAASKVIEEIQDMKVDSRSDLNRLREELSKWRQAAENIIGHEAAKASVIAAIEKVENRITAEETRRAKDSDWIYYMIGTGAFVVGAIILVAVYKLFKRRGKPSRIEPAPAQEAADPAAIDLATMPPEEAANLNDDDFKEWEDLRSVSEAKTSNEVNRQAELAEALALRANDLLDIRMAGHTINFRPRPTNPDEIRAQRPDLSNEDVDLIVETNQRFNDEANQRIQSAEAIIAQQRQRIESVAAQEEPTPVEPVQRSKVLKEESTPRVRKVEQPKPLLSPEVYRDRKIPGLSSETSPPPAAEGDGGLSALQDQDITLPVSTPEMHLVEGIGMDEVYEETFDLDDQHRLIIRFQGLDQAVSFFLESKANTEIQPIEWEELVSRFQGSNLDDIIDLNVSSIRNARKKGQRWLIENGISYLFLEGDKVSFYDEQSGGDVTGIVVKSQTLNGTALEVMLDEQYRKPERQTVFVDFVYVEVHGQDVDSSQTGSASSPIAATSSDEVGGIDFNPALLNLQIKRDGRGVPLPLTQQPIENIHIDGFFPVIINVAPINLPLVLGFNMKSLNERISLTSSSPLSNEKCPEVPLSKSTDGCVESNLELLRRRDHAPKIVRLP